MSDIPHRINLKGGWVLHCLVDEDGHLNVYIENLRDEVVTEIPTGQGDGDKEQFALRFTTPLIEGQYIEDED